MGIPIETGIENLEEVLLKLSVTDRVKLIQWISESVVAEGEDTATAADVPGEQVDITKDDRIEASVDSDRYYPVVIGGQVIRFPQELSQEEWEAAVNKSAGSWADHPMSAEELIEDIYGSRTISTREIKWDD